MSDRAEQALDQVREENYRNLKIKGIALLDRNKEGEEAVKGVPVVSDSQDLLDYVWQEYVDEVIFVGIEEKGHRERNGRTAVENGNCGASGDRRPDRNARADEVY